MFRQTHHLILRLVGVDEKTGNTLNTASSISHHEQGRSFRHEQEADATNFGYSIKRLEEPGIGIRDGSLINPQATEIGRMISPVSDAERFAIIRKRQEEQQAFDGLIRSIRKDEVYLRDLLQKLAEVEQKLAEIKQQREELFQDELLAGDLSGATPEERRANKLRVAARLEIDASRYTDANGNINNDALDRVIREEIARRREQLAREEAALLAQRDELLQQYAKAEGSRSAYQAQARAILPEILKLSPEEAAGAQINPAALQEVLFTTTIQKPKAHSPQVSAVASEDDLDALGDVGNISATLELEADTAAIRQEQQQAPKNQPAPMLITNGIARSGSVATALSWDDIPVPSNVITAKFAQASNPPAATNAPEFFGNAPHQATQQPMRMAANF